jgi:hypothetical protein
VVNWLGEARAGGIGAVWGVDAVPGSYQAQPAPSWPNVIVTTLQVWLWRRVFRVPDGPDTVRLAPIPCNSSCLAEALAFRRAQRAPFLAAATVSGIGAAVVLRIVFTAPSPLGLVSAHTSNNGHNSRPRGAVSGAGASGGDT